MKKLKDFIELLEEIGFEESTIPTIIGKIYIYLATGEKAWEQYDKEYRVACELGVLLLQEKKESVIWNGGRNINENVTCRI